MPRVGIGTCYRCGRWWQMVDRAWVELAQEPAKDPRIVERLEPFAGESITPCPICKFEAGRWRAREKQAWVAAGSPQ